MKKLFLVASVFVVFCLAGCTSHRHSIVNQFNATDANFLTMKKGSDCRTDLLFIIPLSQMNIEQAAKNANIQKVKYVEHHTKIHLLYSSVCVDVFGE